MPRPTEPVKRVCYADDLTVWATGVKIPDLKDSLNSYLEKITAYLKDNSLLIYAPKVVSNVVRPRHTTNQDQPGNTYRGLTATTSLSFNNHSNHVAERVSSRNNILKALAGTSWGQQKETSLMTYKAVGRSIINYAAHVWSTNLRDTYYGNIQHTQNEALRIATGCHRMSSVDYLHVEAEANVLKVREHSELLSAQYLTRCLEPENANNSITTKKHHKKQMK